MKKLILILLFCSTYCPAQRADFVRENITFRLDSNYFSVEGLYYFLNRSDTIVNSEIFYPFPAYAGPEIDSIQVMNLWRGEVIRFTSEGSNGISFRLHLDKSDSAYIHIYYRQRLTSDSAVYILKTTAGWGKPLEVADFKLITPASITIKNFSYIPDKSYKLNNIKIYTWQKYNFMPRKDMVFRF